MKNRNTKIIKGNLIDMFKDGEVDCIAHQCNTVLISEDCGGIAGVIFKNFKEAAITNTNEILTYRQANLSYSLLGKTSGSMGVFNMYSQYKPGHPTTGIDSMECRLSYLKEALYTIKDAMYASGLKSLGIPLIASGLAKQKGFHNMPDLEYFKRFILPTVKESTNGIEVKIIVL